MMCMIHHRVLLTLEKVLRLRLDNLMALHLLDGTGHITRLASIDSFDSKWNGYEDHFQHMYSYYANASY
ncbi:hypothetical protein ACSQ67_008507 [Phaseolus vulgaris]